MHLPDGAWGALPLGARSITERCICKDNAGAGRVWDRGDASTGLTLWTGRGGAGQRARAAAHLVEAVRNGEEGADEKEPRHPEARRWLANFGVHALRRRKQTNKQARPRPRQKRASRRRASSCGRHARLPPPPAQAARPAAAAAQAEPVRPAAAGLGRRPPKRTAARQGTPRQMGACGP